MSLPAVDAKLLDDAEASQMVELIVLAKECRYLRKQVAHLVTAIPRAVATLRRVRCVIEAEIGEHLPVRNRATIVIQNAQQELEEYLI